MDAYAACLSDTIHTVKRDNPALHSRSLRALAIRYYASANYQDLSDGSKSIYRRTLEPFLIEHGHRRADQMQRDNVIAIIGSMADRPGAASMLRKRLRVLLRFGIDLGWMKQDPTLRVKGYRSTELHTWTEEELAQFEARWPIGTKQRLAFGVIK